jgi:hypothetical protein
MCFNLIFIKYGKSFCTYKFRKIYNNLCGKLKSYIASHRSMNSTKMNKIILKISSVAIFMILISSYVGTNSNAYAIWGHGVSHGPSLGYVYGYKYTDGLTIDGKTFDISNFHQVIPTQTFYVNVPSTITLKIFHTDGAQSIQHVALYFNQGSNPSIYTSDTWIQYEKDTGVTTHDPNNMFKTVTANVSLQGHYMYLTLKITPHSEMNTSNIIVNMWDYRLYTTQSIVNNAFQIIKWHSSLS